MAIVTRRVNYVFVCKSNPGCMEHPKHSNLYCLRTASGITHLDERGSSLDIHNPSTTSHNNHDLPKIQRFPFWDHLHPGVSDPIGPRHGLLSGSGSIGNLIDLNLGIDGSIYI